MKIYTIYGQPVLDINTREHGEFGLNRDRNPDSGWNELHGTTMEKAKEVELTDELKITLLEDLAFAYGQNSKKFNEKLREFKLI
jgi:acyl-CoA-binding protein